MSLLKKYFNEIWRRLRPRPASEPESEQSAATAGRVARRLDFYGSRLILFLLVIILLAQLNFSLLQSTVLAVLFTLLWHYYLQRLPRQRLTKLARSRLQQLQAKETATAAPSGQSRLGGRELLNRLFTVRGIRGLISSGAFLIVFGLFFDQWLRWYFVSFGLMNVLLAGGVYLKLTSIKDAQPADDSSEKTREEENSCENLVPPVQ